MFRLLPRCVLLTVTCGMLSVVNVYGQNTWYVDDDAPGDPGPGDSRVSDPLADGSAEHPYDAILLAVTAASDGDTVLVRDGTYNGWGNRDISLRGKSLAIKSQYGPRNCIIDCERLRIAFYMSESTSPTVLIEGFTIINGSSGYGGAIRCNDSGPTTIRNCWIGYCVSRDHGGGIWAGDDDVIVDCVIAYNTALGLECLGGGVYCENDRITITNCELIENHAEFGGGIFVWVFSSDVAISNCLFSGNSAEYDGGGLALYNCRNTSVTNCTVVGNTAAVGAGIFDWGQNCTVTNCIVWDNYPDQIQKNAQTSDPTYCNVQGGMFGTGNIDVYPLFFSPDMGDYRLMRGSPCIDSGDNTSVPADSADLDGDGDRLEPMPLDLEGYERFVDDPSSVDSGVGDPPVIDMGAYEYQACWGDVDGDGNVDLSDLAALLASYNRALGDPSYNPHADYNLDEIVDISDLAELLANYGCP